MIAKVSVKNAPPGCASCMSDDEMQCIASRLCIELPEDTLLVSFSACPPGDKTRPWVSKDDCGNPVGPVKRWNGVNWAAPIST